MRPLIIHRFRALLLTWFSLVTACGTGVHEYWFADQVQGSDGDAGEKKDGYHSADMDVILKDTLDVWSDLMTVDGREDSAAQIDGLPNEVGGEDVIGHHDVTRDGFTDAAYDGWVDIASDGIPADTHYVMDVDGDAFPADLAGDIPEDVIVDFIIDLAVDMPAVLPDALNDNGDNLPVDVADILVDAADVGADGEDISDGESALDAQDMSGDQAPEIVADLVGDFPGDAAGDGDTTQLLVCGQSDLENLYPSPPALLTTPFTVTTFWLIKMLNQKIYLFWPEGLAYDAGNLYISDTTNRVIRVAVLSNGLTTTLSGALFQNGSVDGSAADARFQTPKGLVFFGGMLYVADGMNHSIRKIDPATGAVVTVAGMLGEPGFADGMGTAARFNDPSGLTKDNTYIYITDSGNHVIRRFHPVTLEVVTIAGFPGEPDARTGTCNDARFHYPVGITTDGLKLYIADTGSQTIRMLDLSTGDVSIIAGKPYIQGSNDGIGTEATFDFPTGIVFDGTNLIITDINSNVVRHLNLQTMEVLTLAGKAYQSYASPLAPIDGVGDAARFDGPSAIIHIGLDWYVLDRLGGIVRKLQQL